MMLKKLGSLLAVAAAIAFGSSAQAQVLLAGFESGVSPAAGWADDGGSPPATTPTLSTLTNPLVATEGLSALQINPVPGSKNYFMFNISDNTGAFRSALSGHRKLLADFTYHGAQMQGQYANVDKISIQTVAGGYWHEVLPTGGDNWQTAPAGPPATTTQFTREWSLATFPTIYDAVDPWVSIVFSINYDRAFFGQGAHPRFWVDNIRVADPVPEPTTVGLATCALAGLGMLRRRRR
jgi:hypothetical protein